jgi:hypothetical protein
MFPEAVLIQYVMYMAQLRYAQPVNIGDVFGPQKNKHGPFEKPWTRLVSLATNADPLAPGLRFLVHRSQTLPAQLAVFHSGQTRGI